MGGANHDDNVTWQFSSKKLIVFDWIGCLACF